ncbi:GNAT family N-acetyltransferase [Micromonospora sp. NPDC049679]|uniref:GNAT family N-acetyltransferase n=1 Tax=Micromonospora sp. NPDC049679 TaxID=3155920 RepID=UPI0033EC78D3
MPSLVSAFLPAGSLARHEQPSLCADELLLRPWARYDATAVVAAYSDPAIQQWHAKTMTVKEACDWIAHWAQRWADETGAGWAIAAGGAVVGQISVRRIRLDEGGVEFSYWMLPAGRGHAVASRALTTVTAWLFETVGIHRAELAHSTRNTASCRVAVKANFSLEGTKRQEALHTDGWHDMHLHARINTLVEGHATT